MNFYKICRSHLNRVLCIFIALIAIVCTFCGCASVEREELEKAAPEIIERSRELLDYVYRDGLPYDTNGETIRKGFYPVSDEAEFKTKEEFLNALSEVFTVGYVSVISNTAFSEINVDEGRIEPRYIASDKIDEKGRLYINTDFQINAVKREVDFDSFKIIKCNKYMAKVEMKMLYDDHTSEVDTFVFKKENGKWKLDSAAY